MKRAHTEELAGAGSKRLSKSLFDTLVALGDDVPRASASASADPLRVAWHNIVLLHEKGLALDTGLALLRLLGATDDSLTAVFTTAVDDDAVSGLKADLLAIVHQAGVYHLRALLECGHKRTLKRVARDMLSSKVIECNVRTGVSLVHIYCVSNGADARRSLPRVD